MEERMIDNTEMEIERWLSDDELQVTLEEFAKAKQVSD